MSEELERRTAELVGVSFPQRLIELIVMPYETETLVPYRGKVITEICTRGAYDGVEARNDRIRVNLNHEVAQTVGRAIRFHPAREEGLVAEIKISDTGLGEDTLKLARDGCLDASAGFRLLRDKDGQVVPNAETWETRTRRRLNRLFLGHIALTPEPAYETANVLAVRTTTQPEPVGATPNLDRYRLMLALDELADLDARYVAQ